MKKIFTLLLLAYSSVSFSQSLVISQVYGAGGNSGSVYTNDFVELFNPTANPINVNDWSVQYNSATSTTTTWQKTKLPNVIILPGHYFLVSEGMGTGGTTPLPTADVVGTIAMSGTAGKVVLVSDTNAIAIACPTGANIIDKVGYGTTATCFEGGATVASGGNTNSFFRANNGCTDTNNNNADFSPAAAGPRNSASPVNNCGGGPLPSLTANPTTIPDFGSINVGSNSASASFTISGADLTGAPGNITITAPSANFQVSNDNSIWGASTTVAYTSATLASTVVYVRFTPQSAGDLNGSVSISGGGVATAVNVAVKGVGVATVPTLGATTLATFGNVCVNATTGPNSFNLNGVNLTNADITVGPLSGYTFTTTSGGTYSASLTLTQAGGTYSQDIYVKFKPTGIQSYNGNIPVAGGGDGSSISVAVTGSGVSNPPAETTGTASGITAFAAVLTGSITDTGCTSVTVYGIEYSIVNGFTNGSGTKVSSTNISANIYSSAVAGLTPSTTYYYKAYATNAAGISYGAQRSFTTLACVSPTVETDTVHITTQFHDAEVGGALVDTGCSNITAYGIEYSSIGGFANGKGIKVYSTNISGNNFTAQLSGLIQNTAYYFKAFAVNSGGTAYGVQDTLTTKELPSGLVVYSVPVQRGQLLRYSMNTAKNAHYKIQLMTIVGQVLFSKDIIIQVGFIDDSFIMPAGTLPGAYTLCVTPQGGERIYKKIIVQ